uniref:Uncharacterized protein n=1 Tax=Parascaris univalens TaxID=6257 RepID=A0A915ASK8_PARUN
MMTKKEIMRRKIPIRKTLVRRRRKRRMEFQPRIWNTSKCKKIKWMKMKKRQITNRQPKRKQLKTEVIQLPHHHRMVVCHWDQLLVPQWVLCLHWRLHSLM